MTDQKPEVEVDAEHASTNFYWQFGKEQVFSLQTTVRGVVSPEQIEAHLASAIAAMTAVVKHGGQSKQQAAPPQQKGQQAAQSAPPVPEVPLPLQASPEPSQAQPAQPLSFAAELLVPTTSGGDVYWKVKGGKFGKFGVTVWPEVLEAAGFDVEQLDPLKEYVLTGYTATYLVKVKDGKEVPDKVIKLSK